MHKAPERTENNLSILGCGWLGLPLARFFVNKNMTVKGSVSAKEKFSLLEKYGILPYQIYLNPDFNKGFDEDFFNSKILIINFPPQQREDIEEFHCKQFEFLIREIRSSPIKKVIFTSSTSVYANTNGVVDENNEDMPEKAVGRALRVVEKMLMAESHFVTSIVRFGGLFGYDRKPGKFFAVKKQVKGATVPVNLIHQDDCIGIIGHIIENELWGEIYNACCPEHPTRKEFYAEAAKQGNFLTPAFIETSENYKLVSPEKIISNTGYEFKFKNPINALF